jgi:hypothetical protein
MIGCDIQLAAQFGGLCTVHDPANEDLRGGTRQFGQAGLQHALKLV